MSRRVFPTCARVESRERVKFVEEMSYIVAFSKIKKKGARGGGGQDDATDRLAAIISYIR